MKRILIMACAALIATAGIAQTNASKQALEDSLSVQLGRMQGYGIIASSAAKSDFNKTEFISAFNNVMAMAEKNPSYVEGLSFALEALKQFNQMETKQGMNINKEKFIATFINVLNAGQKPSDAEAQKLSMDLTTTIMGLQQFATTANGEKGKAYIEQQMAKDKGFVKTASGLVYKMHAAGNGENFKAGDVVQLKYKGTHIDGKVFDESTETVEFPIDRLVPGFQEALKLMKPGSKLTAIIPGNLAYGDRGSQGVIEPNETLVFEIETFGVKAPEEKKAEEKK